MRASLTGIKVYKDPRRATLISPAATIRRWPIWQFPRILCAWRSITRIITRVGDEWPKVDYANMAKVDRMVALGLMQLASERRSAEVERESDARYAEAAKK